MALARKPFVVIDAEILSSSVWSEAAHVKLVWLTLLILCDTEGYVGAAIPGIAHAAGVSLDQAREALALFMEPDPDSRTQKDEGRRLEVADRGFKILNFVEHLDRLSADRKRTRDRVRKFRERKRQMADGNVTVLPGNREQGIGTRDKTEERRAPGPANPLIDRVSLERECLSLVREVSALTGDDPVEVIAQASGYKGAATTKLNPMTMSDDRLANTVRDLRADVVELRKKGEASAANK
jgi:hypothetical protein